MLLCAPAVDLFLNLVLPDIINATIPIEMRLYYWFPCIGVFACFFEYNEEVGRRGILGQPPR